MAASRRSPSMTDQWREEEHRYHRHRRAQDLPRRRSRSPGAWGRRESGDDRFRSREEVTESKHRSRKHYRSSQDVVDRARDRSRGASRKDFDQRAGYLEDAKFERRQRDRPVSPPRFERRHSNSPEASSHPRDYRKRERSPRYYPRAASPERRYLDRRPSSRSPRRSYRSSREYYYENSSYRSREPYASPPRRRRSRSPTFDYYRAESPHRSTHSPGRHSRQQRDPYRSRGEEHSDIHPKESKHSRLTDPAKSSLSPLRDRPSKSSRRSEKQRQRTLRHLRERTQANDFLRQLSVSPPSGHDSEQEAERMQQSTRPIQSILDDPAREPTPPRPIPSFDTSNTGSSNVREPFSTHGVKPNDIHPGHRRGPPHIDTRQHYGVSPQYMTPTSSHHGSPTHSGSPYSQGRGGWGTQYYMNQQG